MSLNDDESPPPDGLTVGIGGIDGAVVIELMLFMAMWGRGEYVWPQH